MAGFTSYDDFINEATVNGKTFRQDWNKLTPPTTNATAGDWTFTARGAGNPPADALFNTGTSNTVFQPITNSTANAAAIQHGGNVTPDYKFITNATAYGVAATSALSLALLVDVVGFVRCDATTTTKTVTQTYFTFSDFTADAGSDVCTHTNINLMPYTNVRLTTTLADLPLNLATGTDYYVIKVSDTTCKLATSYANAVAGTAIDIADAGTGVHTFNTILPRYTDGAGLQMFFYNNNSVAMGAPTPNMSFTYTNSAQTAGRATPTVLPIGRTLGYNGHVLYSGVGTGKYGPFVPLQSGDSGISRIETVVLSASYTSGEYSAVLCRPLISMPMPTAGVVSEREFFTQIAGGMRRVYDGAALYWLLYNGSATVAATSFTGDLTFAWG